MLNLCLQKLKLKGDFPAKKNTLNKLKMVCWALLISPLGQDGQLADFRHFSASQTVRPADHPANQLKTSLDRSENHLKLA